MDDDNIPPSPIDISTQVPRSVTPSEDRESRLTLTILCHPDLGRVGELVTLGGLGQGSMDEGSWGLSRLEPRFTPVRGGSPRGLEDPFLSRRPIVMASVPGGGVRLDPSGTSTELEIDNEPVDGVRILDAASLARGVVLLLSRRIALVLRMTDIVRPVSIAPEIVGECAAIRRMRHEIRQVADLDFPVLLRGESGTGKELVARAIHEQGPRVRKPYLTLNIGAIPRELAAAELFGATKGAYTGAHRERRGFFQRAEGGTLFLDEIGVAPSEVQVSLLRALETGEIQPVGSERTERVSVRVLSATDADLEKAMDSGEFRSPLLHRLAAYEITLAPLRDRREDIGRLFLTFLERELEAMGEEHRLAAAEGDEPWIPAKLIAQLALDPWRGNVRQLRNVVRQLAVASRGQRRMEIPSGVERLLEKAMDQSRPDPGTGEGQRYRSLGGIVDAEIMATLRQKRFNIAKAAEGLGVSTSALNRWIDSTPTVRRAAEVSPTEIEAAREQFGGDVEAMAESLGVSSRGLRLWIRKLGLS